MTGAVFAEELARPLLIAHAVLGFATVFSATHLAAYALLSLSGRGLSGLRRFSWIAPAALAPQFALGLVLYPTYRVRVRLPDFDLHAPRVAQLFDLKEHLAAISLFLICAAALLARGLLKPAASPPGLRGAVATLSVAGASLLWATALLGLYVTARHPVGTP